MVLIVYASEEELIWGLGNTRKTFNKKCASLVLFFSMWIVDSKKNIEPDLSFNPSVVLTEHKVSAFEMGLYIIQLLLLLGAIPDEN